MKLFSRAGTKSIPPIPLLGAACLHVRKGRSTLMCFERPKYRHAAGDSEKSESELFDVVGARVSKLDQEAVRPWAPCRARFDEVEVVPFPGEGLQEITQSSRPVIRFNGERRLELPDESPRSVDLGFFLGARIRRALPHVR